MLLLASSVVSLARCCNTGANNAGVNSDEVAVPKEHHRLLQHLPVGPESLKLGNVLQTRSDLRAKVSHRRRRAHRDSVLVRLI